VTAAVRVFDFGSLFRLVRQELEVSQEALGLAVELDQSRVCKVETGGQRLRDIQVVARIARALAIPFHLLGFAETPAAETPAAEEPPSGGVWADRREFITAVTTLVLSAPPSQAGITVPVPDIPPDPLRRVGSADVERIEAATQTFREWGFRSSGAVSQAAVGAQLHSVRDTARTAICAGTHVRRRLLIATADLASVTAWSSYDLEHHDRARQLWLVALEASKTADEPDLTATILRHLAHQALHLAQPAEALQYLRVAHAVATDTRQDRCGAVLAETTAYEAWAHAATGHSAGCRRAIELAQEEFAIDTRLPVPAWRAHFDAVELKALVGHSLHVLANHDPEAAPAAYEALSAAVASRSDAYARAGALNLVALAATCFQGGRDMAAGVELGRTAVDAVHRIGSSRIRTRTRALLQATTPFASVPDVANLRHLITTEAGQAGPLAD
jgi:transcriptional regulator with XRE-family HTH domain